MERSGLVEEYHHGAVAVADSTGRVVASFGDVDRQFFLRSSAKPFQAYTALEAGVSLPDTHLALACASHSGDPVHVAIVEDILARHGLDVGALACPPARPVPSADRRLAAAGTRSPQTRFHNCSGKHAAMLAACVVSGWDLASYTSPHHPLQRRVESLMVETTGVDLGPPGVDGCGVPTWRTTTAGLARAFALLEVDPRFERIRTVMGRYPLLISGEDRPDALIGRWLGAAAKGGAAGCLGIALAGHGIGVKSWSGSGVIAGVGAGVGLGRLGVVVGAVQAALVDVFSPPVLGGGSEVGRIRSDAVLESV